MSVLNTIPNVKIPYPSEGVIRTAQIDDTVSPTNSVQLAVNMNFDRVGAIQTRPGVTQFADDLVDAINNYGTLRNAIIPPGFDNLSQLGTTDNLAAPFKYPAAIKINDTKIAVFWTGATNHGICQNFTIDENSGDVTALGSPLTFEGTFNANNKAILVSATQVLNVWTSNGNDGLAQVFDVSADSIVAMSSPLDFDTSLAQSFSLAQIDSTHFICFWASGLSSDGTATVFAVNLGSGVVTQPGSPLTFHSGFTSDNSCVALGDGTHFLNFFFNSPGHAQVFEVNTGTWAITALGTPLVFSSFGENNNALSTGDGQHFVNIFRGSTGSRGEAQCYFVDPFTFAVTTVGTPVLVTAHSGNDLTAIGFGDGNHFVAFFADGVGTGFVQVVAMDPATFNMSIIGPLLSGYDFANGGYTSAVDLTANKVLVVWGNVSGAQGKAAMFVGLGSVVEGRWLYAGSGDEVFNTAPGDAGAWVSRRSGLAQVSKPRFAQFLNYEWMVNGNEQLGGDPVATSNGGNFGTDLVPADFPKGDYINAGFEGRVWVVNKTLGIIYYTDIVQFTPPNVYTLTYAPTVNFISQIAPQTGQQFTALIQVPRALLVFTEDSIFRIYGASSVDAYPGYNVGTFSQESIIQTKTGIFFHHSSGFYQFDYGSQPVEISRRIIDFVKAIPRTFYQDITGVWDGFDNVEWNIGPVTVEGVFFANAYVRYTISTQVWTIYDYAFETTANIYYDDGVNLNHLVGTSTGKTGALDSGFTDFTQSFYYEFIDRWRAYTDMYYEIKSASGFNVYSENAAGSNLSYQPQKNGPNAWLPIGTVDDKNNSIMPNSDTEDFDVMRLRLAGNTTGAQVVVHGIEITSVTIKGQDTN